jgi:hypothetical protein
MLNCGKVETSKIWYKEPYFDYERSFKMRNETTDFTGKSIFIGIDVHKKNYAISGGQQRDERRHSSQ